MTSDWKVRRAPRRRGNPRPSQSKAHAVRPVEDITEDELQLVAENMTDKVYNSATVSLQQNSCYVALYLNSGVVKLFLKF